MHRRVLRAGLSRGTSGFETEVSRDGQDGRGLGESPLAGNPFTGLAGDLGDQVVVGVVVDDDHGVPLGGGGDQQVGERDRPELPPLGGADCT